MPVKPFSASKLKIKRAKRHVAELAETIREFLAKRPFSLIVTTDENEPAFKTLMVRVSDEIPEDLPAIIGDAIHNCRSALDLMACDLVRLSGKSSKGVRYPFANSEAELQVAIEKSNIIKAGSDIVDLIRSTAPYHRGNELLRALHDLDIIDKHRTIVPVANLVSLPAISSSNVIMEAGVRIGPVVDGMRIYKLPIDQDLKIGRDFSGAFHLIFPDDGPLAGYEVEPSLENLTKLVTGIIQTFEIHCLNGRDTLEFPPAPKPTPAEHALAALNRFLERTRS